MIIKPTEFDFRTCKYNFMIYKDKEDFHLSIHENIIGLKNGEKALLPADYAKDKYGSFCLTDCIMSDTTFKNVIANLLSLLEPNDMISVLGKGKDIRKELEILDRQIKSGRVKNEKN